MGKRRASQTSVTLWLDPEEVKALDRIRGTESRSGVATRWTRDRLKPHLAAEDADQTAAAPMAPPPPPLPTEMIEAAVRSVRAQVHDRQRRPSLTVSQVIRAIEMRRSGLSDTAVARRFGCLEGVIAREIDPVERELSQRGANASGQSNGAYAPA